MYRPDLLYPGETVVHQSGWVGEDTLDGRFLRPSTDPVDTNKSNGKASDVAPDLRWPVECLRCVYLQLNALE